MTEENYNYNQKNLIRQMLKHIPEAQKYWDAHVDNWEEHWISFFPDLNSFVHLTEDALLKSNHKLVYKILAMIEEFLESSDEESKGAITYFFFESLINRLEHEDPKYIQQFISMLGLRSKECCIEVDRFWKTKTLGLY